METIKNNIPENVDIFFKNLSELLETKLYFFGSIQRNDYFPGSSDIDVDIFTDNIPSTIYKMQHFLNMNKNDFKKFVWRLNDKTRTFTHGYKVMYKNLDGAFAAEFSIYDEKYKQDILNEHIRKISLPFYASLMLIVLKFFYYKLKMIDKKFFIYLKRKIMSFMIGLPDDEFIILEPKIDKDNNNTKRSL